MTQSTTFGNKFAWLPIKTKDGKTLWLQNVKRLENLTNNKIEYYSDGPALLSAKACMEDHTLRNWKDEFDTYLGRWTVVKMNYSGDRANVIVKCTEIEALRLYKQYHRSSVHVNILPVGINDQWVFIMTVETVVL